MSETFNFKTETYNGISIIRETTTNYVNASQMCSSNGKLFRQYKQTKAFKELIEIYEEFVKINDKPREIQGVVFPTPYFDIEFTKDYQGTYIHPKLVHFIAEYVNKRYAFKVAELMDSINDRVHEQLEVQNLSDLPAHTNQIFGIIVDHLTEQQRELENSQCWGIRDHGDKYDYLDSWNKDTITMMFNKFKQDLMHTVDFAYEDIKRDYPQLLN